jgi:hypothetical protein
VHAVRKDRRLSGSTDSESSMSRQGANDDGDAGARAKAVARLSTLQRLRDDALAKNRQSMLKTIEDMIASELRSLRVEPDSGKDKARGD